MTGCVSRCFDYGIGRCFFTSIKKNFEKTKTGAQLQSWIVEIIALNTISHRAFT
jgi:hypothetical protein